MLYQRALRPLLFRLGGGDPEVAHERVLGALALVSRSPALTRALAAAMSLPSRVGVGQACEVFGLHFPNPVGLAAGFDKNGVAAPALAALGCGFLERAPVTHHPQPGNPPPRLFRLPSELALINRMGFNNEGAAIVGARLAKLPKPGVPLGISLGKSKAASLEEAVADYAAALDLLYPHGDYFAINVSSPNTPELRTPQERDRLDALLVALGGRLRALAAAEGRPTPKPLLVKVAPDLDEAALDEVVEVCLGRGASGLIAVNTTIGRAGLSERVPEAL